VGIRIIKHDPKNTNFNSLKGSGLYPIRGICDLEQRIPRPNPTPRSPVPVPVGRIIPIQNQAVKTSNNSNSWRFNGVIYKTFNSLWVNIPKQSIRLKTNGASC